MRTQAIAKTRQGQKTTLQKIPYGIISGACAMAVFFITLGLIAAYLILSGIAGQTNDTVAFLEHGWQVALLILDIVFVIGFLGGLVMYILKRKGTFENRESGFDEK